MLPEVGLAESVFPSLKGSVRRLRTDLTVSEAAHDLSSSSTFTVRGIPAAAREIYLTLPIREMYD